MDYNQNNYMNAMFKSGDTITFNYSGKTHNLDLPPGLYGVECYGAQGSDYKEYKYGSGGLGAFVGGLIKLNFSTQLYISVGGSNGWNGGGNGIRGAKGGGGASDIRCINPNNYRNRIIVAGGGGGGDYDNDGGAGGGLTGFGSPRGGRGRGGTQTKEQQFQGTDSGGGGYYGGYQVYVSSNNEAGGGGSSFISGYEGCNAVNEKGIPTNQSIHHSGLIFTDAYMNAGYNAGHGKIKITMIELNRLLFLFHNQIGYFINNKFINIPNKHIENLTLQDFREYGNETGIIISQNDQIKILSLEQKDLCSFSHFNKTIQDAKKEKRFNIKNVKKITITDVGNPIYMISNGENLYSWFNEEWGFYKGSSDKLSNTDILNFLHFGMTSEMINSFTEKHWHQLWTNIESIKYINFIVIFNQEAFEDVSIQNIKILKDGFEEAKEYNLDYEVNYPKYLLIRQIRSDAMTFPAKIKIFYSDKEVY